MDLKIVFVQKKADHFEFLIKLQWNGALTENDVSLIITSVLSKN